MLSYWASPTSKAPEFGHSARRTKSMIWFAAKSCAVEELPDLNTLAVVLAENDDGSGERLELQRALSFDAADIESGMDTYCLVVSSGASHYGGVLKWDVEECSLALTFDEVAAKELGVEQAVKIDLKVEASDVSMLRGGLQRVLLQDEPGVVQLV